MSFTIIFEPGSHYTTRDGRRARVYATDGTKFKPIHGAIFDGKAWSLTLWSSEGTIYPSGPDDRDLVSPWVDPPPVVFWSNLPAWATHVAMDENGQWWWYTHEPEQRKNEWLQRSLAEPSIGRIPPAFTPAFTGPWTQSLISRPS